MEELRKQKLINFANDKVMMDAVYGVLLDNFLKKKGNEDINLKGGRFIAIEELQEAWRELDSYKMNDKVDEKISGNVGM